MESGFPETAEEEGNVGGQSERLEPEGLGWRFIRIDIVSGASADIKCHSIMFPVLFFLGHFGFIRRIFRAGLAFCLPLL